MFNRLTAVLAAAFLATACGGGASGTTTGTTSGTATGGSTGGRATTTTTGGSSTGKSLELGVPCSANADCSSGICGLAGSGNCCAVPCNDAGSDPTCGTTGCDDTGSCAFPSAISCGTASCGDGNKLTTSSCNGAGSCVPGKSTSCPQNFGCTSAGTACNTSCTSSADCAAHYACNDGGCLPPQIVGPCTENDDCYSGICGINGKGNCCVGDAGCVTGDPVCGATECDPTNGSCNYADAGTACGSLLQSCTDAVQQNPSICDGKGTCPVPAIVDCGTFICGGDACLASCTDDTSCGVGDFCDTNHTVCCTALSDGATISVDGTAGNDAAGCCSIPGYEPCQTLTEAMKQIDVAQAKNVTINAVVRKGQTWNPAGEVYPIVLGWGVELNGSGLFFSDTNANKAIFDITAVSANDTVGYASLVGTAAKPISIGFDEFLNQTADRSSISVESGSTLYLANAAVNGSEDINQMPTETNAITVAAGGTLVLAQDQSAAITGTVTIGSNFARNMNLGWNGIVCGKSKTAGCTISDAPLQAGVSSLVIQGQDNIGIDAEDNASITLTSSPVIGVAPSDAGFDTCANQSSYLAVLLNGSANMTFKNGTIQCMDGDGFDLAASSNGVPTLTLDSTTIQNVDIGIDAAAGSAYVSNSTILFNYYGVVQDQDSDGTHTGFLDLSGGDGGGTNTVICSDSAENGDLGFGPVGASVVNKTPYLLNADNVTWDTSGPDLFGCDSALDTCTCLLSSCTISTADGGVDGMDAVEIGDAGTITTSGNLLSTVACNFPLPPLECTMKCTPPTFCCIVGQMQECVLNNCP